MSRTTPIPAPDPNLVTKVRAENARWPAHETLGSVPVPKPDPEHETAVRAEAASALNATAATPGPQIPAPDPDDVRTFSRAEAAWSSDRSGMGRPGGPGVPDPDEETRVRSEVALTQGRPGEIPVPDPDDGFTHARNEAAVFRTLVNAAPPPNPMTVLGVLAARQAKEPARVGAGH